MTWRCTFWAFHMAKLVRKLSHKYQMKSEMESMFIISRTKVYTAHVMYCITKFTCCRCKCSCIRFCHSSRSVSTRSACGCLLCSLIWRQFTIKERNLFQIIRNASLRSIVWNAFFTHPSCCAFWAPDRHFAGLVFKRKLSGEESQLAEDKQPVTGFVWFGILLCLSKCCPHWFKAFEVIRSWSSGNSVLRWICSNERVNWRKLWSLICITWYKWCWLTTDCCISTSWLPNKVPIERT